MASSTFDVGHGCWMLSFRDPLPLETKKTPLLMRLLVSVFNWLCSVLVLSKRSFVSVFNWFFSGRAVNIIRQLLPSTAAYLFGSILAIGVVGYHFANIILRIIVHCGMSYGRAVNIITQFLSNRATYLSGSIIAIGVVVYYFANIVLWIIVLWVISYVLLSTGLFASVFNWFFPGGSTTKKCFFCKKNLVVEGISFHQKCIDRTIKCPDCLDIISLQNWLHGHECCKDRIEGGSAPAECSYSKSTFEAVSVPTHDRSCIEKPLQCPKCGKDVATKEWLNHECLIARADGIEKLLRDLKRMMLNGDHSDTTVNVKEEAFKLHKSVLRARNPVFDSKLKNEVQEKTPDILNIDDCEPNQFRTLIHYIYTGNADNLCPENICDLYKVAVAYQEEQMKSECLQIMMNTISVENFCDYTSLALKHDEKELFQKATGLFISKVKEITRNEKWKTFLKRHPVEANDLYMKALDHDTQ